MNVIKGHQFILTLSMIILTSSFSQVFSPLRYGADSETNDIKIEYQFNPIQPNISLYFAVFNPYTQLLKKGRTFSFCFLQQTVREMKADQFNCELVNNKSYYDCLTIENKQNSTIKYLYWQMNEHNLIINQSSQYIPNKSYKDVGNDSKTANIMIGLRGMINSSQFNYLGISDLFYKVLTTNSKSFNGGNYKLNYLSTFSSTFNHQYKQSSINVLLQRFPYCYLYEGKGLSVYNVIFVGGVMRGDYSFYIMSFINYEVNKEKFIMWEGLSFSSDKAGRDMIGIRPTNGVVQDLFCLFARAPWTDNSNNIGGVQNTYLISTSSQAAKNNVSWFYQTNILRPYITNDTVSDEDLIFKINNKYCFVASFIKTSIANPQYSYLDNSNTNIHGPPQCFEPDLDIFESMNSLQCILLGLFIGLIF